MRHTPPRQVRFARAKQIAPYFSWSLFAAGLMFCLGSLQGFASGLNDVSREMQIDTAPQASLVYDRDNHVIFSFATEDRTSVSLDQVSKSMVMAVLAAEDHHFFKHAGMDLIGVARAALVDLKEGGLKEGGSTITQQLVRLVALTRSRTLDRKVREALLALRIERRFPKRRILEAYLNRIYLGDSHYGVEAAARGYFGKTAADLTPGEAALLAGLIKCPSACSPRTAPALAKLRRDTVLGEMHAAGNLSRDEYAAAVAAPIALIPERHDSYDPGHLTVEDGDGNQPCALYFVEAVRREVMSQFGEDDVLRGGLRIHTTVDINLQKRAEESIAARLQQIDPLKKGPGPAGLQGRLEGALVAIDPRTGEVLALVGGRDFRQSPFNRATQARRQPGSAFKPLLFAAAIEQGYTPSSLMTDLDTPVSTPQGAWLPSGEHEASSYTLRQALTVSSNRAAVHLMQLVGIGTTQSYARRLGISSPLPSVPSLAIGTAEVSLLDLSSAYGAFANGGIVAPHTLITSIEDSTGQVVWQQSQARQPYRAIRPGTAFLMSSMLADVINRGTGSRARTEGFKLPAAGKTGTTDDYGDAWFIGYTPHLVTGVWFGYDDHKKIMDRGFAGTVAVPAWAHFMMKATAGQKPDWFQPPNDVEKVTVCRASGLRATDSCKLLKTDDGRPNAYEDYFLLGTAPYDACPGHTAPPPPVDGVAF
jgi:1A family penicillin-binding protein